MNWAFWGPSLRDSCAPLAEEAPSGDRNGLGEREDEVPL
ncbi:MAG: hypothetical protein ACI9C2_001627, partial [Gammaproteobacteria bacterium]